MTIASVSASLVLAAGILLAQPSIKGATLNPKAIPPTRKRLSAPAQARPAMTPEARQRMAQNMKQHWAEGAPKPKVKKPGRQRT
jgi:hypothetical protein